MRYATIIGVVLGLTVLALAPVRGSDLPANTSHRTHIVKAKHKPADPPAQRVCDWIGPGGRAVYRCHTF
jgi:hypothetical protein